jgi:hypothetical protein
MEDETQLIPSLRHLTYRIGPSASTATFVTGQELTNGLYIRI